MLHVGVIARGLRAIAAVLRAASGLDREQHAPLHLIGRVVLAMHGGGAEHKLGERSGVNGFDL